MVLASETEHLIVTLPTDTMLVSFCRYEIEALTREMTCPNSYEKVVAGQRPKSIYTSKTVQHFHF
jgi:hypothetical protein